MKIVIIFFMIAAHLPGKQDQPFKRKELRGVPAVKVLGKHTVASPDNNNQAIVITNPIHSKNVFGQLKVTGKAAANSTVKIIVRAVYYKYTADHKLRKLLRGAGPFSYERKPIIVKTTASGYWTTKDIDFKNLGFSTEYKIVARYNDGKSPTYVTVQNNKLPVVAWD